MSLVTRILTALEALSCLLSCYVGGVGWGNNVHAYLHTQDRLHYDDIFSCPCTHTHTPLAATVWYRLVHLHNDGMLRYDSSFALDATLWYLLVHLHTEGMLPYDFFSCTCTIFHTHTLDVTLWYLFRDRIYQWIFQAHLGKVTTDRQHEKGTENVQIKLFVVKRSKRIIHEVVKCEAFFCTFKSKTPGVRFRRVTMLLVAFKFVEVFWTISKISWDDGWDITIPTCYLYQWTGLRENLQETMVFTIKYRSFL